MAATMIHIAPGGAKDGAERHNKREKALDYLNDPLTKNNLYWEAEDFTTVAELRARIREDYRQDTGKKQNCRATPIREGVVVNLPMSTPEESAESMRRLQKFAKAVEEKYGVRTVGIYIHADEGHMSKLGKWEPNHHAHIVFDYYNWQTHRIRNLKGDFTTDLQTMIAEHTGLERGKSSTRKGLSAIEYKVEQRKKDLKELEARVADIRSLAVSRRQAFHECMDAGVKLKGIYTSAQKTLDDTISLAYSLLGLKEARLNPKIADVQILRADLNKERNWDDTTDFFTQEIDWHKNAIARIYAAIESIVRIFHENLLETEKVTEPLSVRVRALEQDNKFLSQHNEQLLRAQNNIALALCSEGHIHSRAWDNIENKYQGGRLQAMDRERARQLQAEQEQMRESYSRGFHM